MHGKVLGTAVGQVDGTDSGSIHKTEIEGYNCILIG